MHANYTSIFETLEAPLITAFGADAVQLDNTLIEVSNRAFWVRVAHLPAPGSIATLGTNGQTLRTGLTQVDIFTRAGSGRTTTPDDVVALYARHTNFTDLYNVLASRDGGALVEDGNWRETVTVRWSALTDF